MPPSTELLALLIAELENSLPQALELRHRIHSAPELGHDEHATAEAIVDELRMQSRRVAGTGVIARVGSGEPAVAVRAELDGLPVREQTGSPWASANGSMHACGHDVHSAALVALLNAAAALEDRLPAPLMGIFQPSEEAYPSGAQMLVEDGVLAGEVRAIVGVHLQPDLPWGSLAIGAGPVNAACDNIEIVVEGQSAHSAYPHLGRDPILAISSIVVGLHTLVSRRLDPLHPTVLTVGELHAGTSENVIPHSARATMTVRTHAPDDREPLRRMVRELVESMARAHGCRGRIEITAGEPTLDNDVGISEHAQELASAAGLTGSGTWRSCGSDDFAFLRTVAPIAMAFAGLSGAAGFNSRPLHHPEFLPPDEAVTMVARAQAVLYAAAIQ